MIRSADGPPLCRYKEDVSPSLKGQIIASIADRFGKNADDTSFSCDNATIPRLNRSDRCYVYLNGDSDADDEHGVTIVICDGRVAGVSDADDLDDIFDWDAGDEIDEVLADGG